MRRTRRPKMRLPFTLRKSWVREDRVYRRWFEGRKDVLIWSIPLTITSISGILIASTQRQAHYVFWLEHWTTALASLEIGLLLARVPLKRLQEKLNGLYIFTIASLIAVRLIGTSALGAQRWISIAGVHVQPSEFAKITVILTLASVLSDNRILRFTDILFPSATIAIPWLLVFIQPDLGTSLVFGAILVVMLFWAGMRIPWMVILISPLVTAILSALLPVTLAIWIPLCGFLAYRSLIWKRTALVLTIAVQIASFLAVPIIWMHGLKSYQRDRLILFMDPEKDPLGGGYHLLQSKIGIGSGQFFGTGFLKGDFTRLQFVPEQHTDFIFSALGEETGFIGSICLLICFGTLIWNLVEVARRARTDFESLMVIGVTAMLTFEIIVNINMTIGLGPITGIPLPWMSYGRCAMLVNFLSLGLCASVARRNQAPSSW
uniref:Uncharacterized protein n=1 Tax=Paulinella chromatophora TaxID=39717 RepID=B1X524_PAUCH|nr:hypothetical protein PCC_0615 [Paulinella chromatophora]ACB43043.1 hypothetical protein PCC_0615 [Paulinella chromatophora]